MHAAHKGAPMQCKAKENQVQDGIDSPIVNCGLVSQVDQIRWLASILDPFLHPRRSRSMLPNAMQSECKGKVRIRILSWLLGSWFFGQYLRSIAV